MGIIDKSVTGPLWRQLRESTTSVLGMGSVYCEENWTVGVLTLLEGIALSNDATILHRDEVWTSLIEPNETDVMVQELLQLLFGAFSITTQRQLIDHLPGGKYYSVTDKSVVQETASVPTTNVAP